MWFCKKSNPICDEKGHDIKELDYMLIPDRVYDVHCLRCNKKLFHIENTIADALKRIRIDDKGKLTVTIEKIDYNGEN